MAVLIEAISVVIRADSLAEKFPGGWDAFKQIVPNSTLCSDNEIFRVGFMVPKDVEVFVNLLQSMGLVFFRNGEAIDIAVVDQVHGPTSKCEWLEFGRVILGDSGGEIAICRLVATHSTGIKVFFPVGWEYKKSLSSNFSFVPSKDVQKELKFLKHEDGKDVFLNSLTGKEVYVGRTYKK